MKTFRINDEKKKKSNVGIFFLGLFLVFIAYLEFFDVENSQVQQIFMGLAFGVAGLGCIVYSLQNKGGSDFLKFDEDGIEWLEEGKKELFLWSEIEHVDIKYVKHPRTFAKCRYLVVTDNSKSENKCFLEHYKENDSNILSTIKMYRRN